MNPILYPPDEKFDKAFFNHGSGRYYARVSQSETLRDDPESRYPALWIFEAFDAQWFDQNAAPENPDGLESYYSKARLFVLEVEVQDPRAPRLSGLGSVEKATIDDDEPDDWFLILGAPLEGRRLNEGEIPLTIYPNLYLGGIAATMIEAGRAGAERSAQLDRAVSTAHIPDASEQEIDSALAGVAGARIEWMVAYDVGQGNSIGLCESGGSVKAYFDLGGGVNGNRKTFPGALTQFCFTQNPPVILSHWDFDHWSSHSLNGNFTSHSMTWIAPRQKVGPTHVALMTNIQAAGTLLLIAPGFPAKQYGQVHVELCSGKGRNHSGIALTLCEKSGGGGRQMLLPGDARYNYIPSFQSPPTTQYLSVVVPHHGADMRSRTVPVCPSLAHSRLVYSYGAGNTFSHPRHITRMDHNSAGWLDPLIFGAPTLEVRETATRGMPALGHVLLGWKSQPAAAPLPCRGSSCQLQAQQV